MNAMRLGAAVLALLLAPVPSQAAPGDYAAAVAAKGRPGAAVALDASRRPAEILDFLGLKRGMAVLDLVAGGGYYSEIMGHKVGPGGSVVAFQPAQLVSDKARVEWAALAARNPNVRPMILPMKAFGLAPRSFDFTMLHLNYHDFYWENARLDFPRGDPDKVLAVLFTAMKPGGIVGVIDHVGNPGDARVTVDKLHRIDPEVIKADFARAGFMLEAESDLLRVAEDDHTKLVFDPSIRAKTDRVVYRFRKPA